MNPYEPCCWNRMINREQFTIVIHVDDLKPCHKKKEQVSDIIAKLESKIYAIIDPMIVHRGKLYHYIGMTINFRVQGEVNITIYDYINKLINSLLEGIERNNHTVALEYLFQTDNKQPTKLSAEKYDFLKQGPMDTMRIPSFTLQLSTHQSR